MSFGDELELVWPSVRDVLPAIFTTQDYVEALKRLEPALWSEIKAVHGPGGKGTGHNHSPMKLAFDFLNRQTRGGGLNRGELVPSRSGWGSTKVAQFAQSRAGAKYVAGGSGASAPPESGELETVAVPDRDAPPDRIPSIINRIVRDTKMAQNVKRIHKHECQICGLTIELPEGKRYAEAHHVRPLGGVHEGPDIADNILCLCPNHHAQLDLGVIPLDLASLRPADKHQLKQRFADYHNDKIYLGRK